MFSPFRQSDVLIEQIEQAMRQQTGELVHQKVKNQRQKPQSKPFVLKGNHNIKR